MSTKYFNSKLHMLIVTIGGTQIEVGVAHEPAFAQEMTRPPQRAPPSHATACGANKRPFERDVAAVEDTASRMRAYGGARASRADDAS